eukprot:12806513-Alexandrium_andersonii.AAC.1
MAAALGGARWGGSRPRPAPPAPVLLGLPLRRAGGRGQDGSAALVLPVGISQCKQPALFPLGLGLGTL